MGKRVPGEAGENGSTGCPFCTGRIPAGAPVCPHCGYALSPGGGLRSAGRRAAGRTADKTSEYWERYGIWVKAAGPVLLALVVLLLVYRQWAGITVSVVPNPSLPVRAETEKRRGALVIRGTVTNQGADVPDLSLRSVGVIVELAYRDGSRDRKTVFPKSEFRGEGALLRGESGRFETEVRAEGLMQVVLRSEVVDLGQGQRLIPPGGRGSPVTGR